MNIMLSNKEALGVVAARYRPNQAPYSSPMTNTAIALLHGQSFTNSPTSMTMSFISLKLSAQSILLENITTWII
jgi:hypothetical protein